MGYMPLAWKKISALERNSLTWMVRTQCVITECLDSVHICHIFQVFIIPCLNLLDLVRCTESVEEVDERNFSLDCCKMCYRSKVHNFLYGRLTQHCTTSLTTGHNIGMISENGKCVGSKCTSGYVEYTRKPAKAILKAPGSLVTDPGMLYR